MHKKHIDWKRIWWTMGMISACVIAVNLSLINPSITFRVFVSLTMIIGIPLSMFVMEPRINAIRYYYHNGEDKK